MALPASPATKLVLKIGSESSSLPPAAAGPASMPEFPSAVLARGPRLLLVTRDAAGRTTEVDLTEEGVGLGVPVVRSGSRCRYPGSVRVRACGPHAYRYTYHLDLTDRVGLFGGRVFGTPLDRAREWFSGLHRRRPKMRRPLDNLGELTRRVLGATSWFGRAPFPVVVDVIYRVHPDGRGLDIEVEAHADALSRSSEVTLMNESGGNTFTQYRDRSGVFQDDAIGSWREVEGDWAAMGDAWTGAWFAVSREPVPVVDPRVVGPRPARMYAGREVADGRLAWAGIALVLPTGARTTAYRVSYGLGGVEAAA